MPDNAKNQVQLHVKKLFDKVGWVRRVIFFSLFSIFFFFFILFFALFCFKCSCFFRVFILFYFCSVFRFSCPRLCLLLCVFNAMQTSFKSSILCNILFLYYFSVVWLYCDEKLYTFLKKIKWKKKFEKILKTIINVSYI